MPTLEQIQAKLKKLQAQADVLIAKKAQVAVDQIRDLMIKHGLTTADIEAKAKARRAARGLNGHSAAGQSKAGAGKAVPKYRDHRTGATWTGHGRAPAWIASVKDRTQFLIESASELKSATKAVAKAAVTVTKGSKGQPKGAQPAKYLNPKTGATWSGRGPAPAWLATVKDRTKFLIEGAAAAGDAGRKVASKAAAKAGKVKSAATTGAVSKKAAAKKTVARKAVAKKAVAKKAAKKVANKVTAKKASSVARSVTRKVATKKASVKSAAVKKAPAKKATTGSTAAKAPRKVPSRKPAVTTVAAPSPAPAPVSTPAPAAV